MGGAEYFLLGLGMFTGVVITIIDPFGHVEAVMCRRREKRCR